VQTGQLDSKPRAEQDCGEPANSENRKIYRKKLSERVLCHLKVLFGHYCLKMIVFLDFVLDLLILESIEYN
jgi:hypothetical protein